MRPVFHIVTQLGLALKLHRLPAMLHTQNQNSIPTYSKGARGLSVYLRGRGIFTAATISPSYSLRQRPARYTIRAGRNLPDKEFRYLRTVIVTAAVYRGLTSKLLTSCDAMTSPLDLPAPGTCHSLYIVLST